MLQLILDGSTIKGVLDDDKLVAGTPLLRGWFTEGAPALKGSGTKARRESVQTVKPADELFGLAVLDALEDYELELREVVAPLAKASAPPDTNVGGGQDIRSGSIPGGTGGANIQLKLPDKPHNPHDVAGVSAYLRGMHDSPNVVVRRDPSIYQLDAAIDWLYPIADAYGNVKNIIAPDETENRAKEHHAMVVRTSKQDREVPVNNAAPSGAGAWHPAQREGAARYPDKDDSDRVIETKVQGDEVEKGGGEGSRGGQVVGHTSAGKPIYADKHAHEMSREEFLGKPTRTKAGNASELKASHTKRTEAAPAEPFKVEGHSSEFAVHRSHNDDASRAHYVVTKDGKPAASYDGTNLVVDRKHRRQGIGTELVAKFRTDNPHIAVAETRTKNAQKTQEAAFELIQRRARQTKRETSDD